MKQSLSPFKDKEHLMAQPLTEMAKDLTLALIEAKLLAPEDLHQQLAKTHASLLELKAREDNILEGGGGRAGQIESTLAHWHHKSGKKASRNTPLNASSAAKSSSNCLRATCANIILTPARTANNSASPEPKPSLPKIPPPGADTSSNKAARGKKRQPTYKPMNYPHPLPQHDPNASEKRQPHQARERGKHAYRNRLDLINN
jgi:hypothetical protein